VVVGPFRDAFKLIEQVNALATKRDARNGWGLPNGSGEEETVWRRFRLDTEYGPRKVTGTGAVSSVKVPWFEQQLP
jgi:hypothetical protein